MSLLGRDLAMAGGSRRVAVVGPPADRRVTVAVRARDHRVAESLRHLLAATDDLVVLDGAADADSTPDVGVVEVGQGFDSHDMDWPRGGAGTTPLVVIGSDSTARSATAGVPFTVYLDRAEAADRLPDAVRALAIPRPAPAPTAMSWPRILLVVAAVFVGPWAVWLSRIAEDRGLTSWHLPQGLALWTIPPLLLAAVAATAGRTGVRDLGSRIVRFRVPAWTYLAALATPVAVAATAAGLVHLAGGDVPLGVLMSLPAAALYLVYGTGLFLLTEEAAWRGALLPRLDEHVGTAWASVLVGLVWGVWHLPLLAVQGAADHGLPAVPFFLLVVGTSVLITALVQAARGSVVVAAVFHASFDASYSWFGVVGEDHAMLWAATGLTVVGAVTLLGVGGLRRRWVAGAEAAVPPAAARPTMRRLPRLGSGLPLAGSVYVASWLVGLVVAPVGPAHDATPRVIHEFVGTNSAVLLLQSVLVHGIAGVALGLVALGVGSVVAAGRARAVAVGAGVAAAIASLVQTGLAVAEVRSAAGTDLARTASWLQAVNDVDVVKLALLAVFAVALGRAAGDLLPGWVRTLGRWLAPLLVVGATAFVVGGPLPTTALELSLVLLLVWVGAVSWRLGRRAG